MKISTGFKDLDKALNGGFEDYSLVTIGARPGMGKTSFLHSLAIKFKEKNLKFKIFSIDMGTEQIQERTQKSLELTDHVVANCFEDLISEMSAYRRYDRTTIFLIDYVQLYMKYDGDESYQECSRIMNELKRFSQSHECLIIVCSQLSRKVEERQGHWPKLTDLRDSGAIEEVSDQVLLLLRREYYDPYDKPGIANVILAKNKHGPCGNIEMLFQKERCLFLDHAPGLYTDNHKEEMKIVFTPFIPN